MRWNSRWRNCNPNPASIHLPVLIEDRHIHMLTNTNRDRGTDTSMISGTNHHDHLALGNHLVHTNALGRRHHQVTRTPASGRQVLDDRTMDVVIPTDHRAHTTNVDQAHLDVNRTTMRDPGAHRNIALKVHHILNDTCHNTDNLIGSLRSPIVAILTVAILIVAILMTGESHPIVK